MAESKRRRKTATKSARVIRVGNMTATLGDVFDRDVSEGMTFPSEDEIRTAMQQMPEDLGWEWSRSRLVPLFERGYDEHQPGLSLVNIATPLGVGVGFGIDLGPMLARVSVATAERWEASVDQIAAESFANLARVAAGVTRRDVQSVVHQGHFFRALGVPGGWASSIVLAGEAELIRIFGVTDQIFTVPARNQLVAFGPGTPTRAVIDITAMLESLDPHPLLMEPFVMLDGVLAWEGMLPEIDDVI